MWLLSCCTKHLVVSRSRIGMVSWCRIQFPSPVSDRTRPVFLSMQIRELERQGELSSRAPGSLVSDRAGPAFTMQIRELERHHWDLTTTKYPFTSPKDDHSNNILADNTPTMNSLVKIEDPGTPESNVSRADSAHCKKEAKNQEDPQQLLKKYLHDTNVYYEVPDKDKVMAKTEGNRDSSTPHPTARIFKLGVGSYFGQFSNSGTDQTIKGIWAPSYEDGLEMPELCLAVSQI